jgi:hypothetical protein
VSSPEGAKTEGETRSPRRLGIARLAIERKRSDLVDDLATPNQLRTFFGNSPIVGPWTINNVHIYS